MWSRDSQLFVLAWVGAIAGILGVVVSALAILHPAGFPIRAEALGSIGVSSLLLGSLTIGLWRALGRLIARSDIETKSITKSLTLNDKTGTDAILVRTQVDRANRKVLNHTLTVSGLAATGNIAEVKVDGVAVPQQDWEFVVNGWRITRVRQGAWAAGDEITRETWIHAVDSFTKNRESLIHEVGLPNKDAHYAGDVSYRPEAEFGKSLPSIWQPAS